MSRFKIINLFDKIFITVSTFLLIYAWINFFLRDLWITFFLSLIFSFATLYMIFYFFNKQRSKKEINKSYFEDIEKNFLAFRLMSKTERTKMLKSILEKNAECKNIKENLTYTINKKCYQILIETSEEKLSQFQLENLVSTVEKNVDILKIICCDFNTNINTKILKNLEIEIVTKKKLYDEFFLTHNTFPNTGNLSTPERKKFKEIMKNFLIPQKAKSYFLCGLFLIFSSIILPYHFYYLIFGSVFLIFSIICKLQPLFKH